MHHLSPRCDIGCSLDHPRRPRLPWLRGLPLLARHVTATMPWITLLTGCLAGTVFLAVLTHVAGTANCTF